MLNLFFAGSFSVESGDTGIWFVREPQDVIAEKNKPLTLECSGASKSSYAPVSYTWLYEGRPLSLDPRRQVQQNGSLYFTKVIQRRKRNRTDEGTYQCLLSNSFGTVASRPAKVSIASMYISLIS